MMSSGRSFHPAMPLRVLRIAFISAILLLGVSLPAEAGANKVGKAQSAGLVFESTKTGEEATCDKAQTALFDTQTFRVKGKTVDSVTQGNPSVDKFVAGVMDTLGFRRLNSKDEPLKPIPPSLLGEKGDSHFLFVAKDDDAIRSGMAKVDLLGSKTKGKLTAHVRKLFVVLLDKDFRKVGDEIRWNFKVFVAFDGDWRYAKGAASQVGWEGVMDSSALRNDILTAFKKKPDAKDAKVDEDAKPAAGSTEGFCGLDGKGVTITATVFSDQFRPKQSVITGTRLTIPGDTSPQVVATYKMILDRAMTACGYIPLEGATRIRLAAFAKRYPRVFAALPREDYYAYVPKDVETFRTIAATLEAFNDRSVAKPFSTSVHGMWETFIPPHPQFDLKAKDWWQDADPRETMVGIKADGQMGILNTDVGFAKENLSSVTLRSELATALRSALKGLAGEYGIIVDKNKAGGRR